MKRILSLLIISTMLLGSMLPAYADNSFPDVEVSSWYYKPVMDLVNMGAINGYPDGRFGPNNNISYAEYLTILVKTTRAGDGNYTSQAGEEWYSSVLKAAFESDIVKMGDVKDYNAPITRADAAKFTERAVSGVLGEDVKVLEGVERAIKDYNSFKSSNGAYHIIQLYSAGIIVGDNNGNFNPYNNLTRAEAATIILRTVKTENRIQVSIPAEETSIVIEKGKYQGCMKPDYATEYHLQALETARFYKEGSKYYISMDLPELPEGFSFEVGVLAHAIDREGNTLSVFADTFYSKTSGNKYLIEVISKAPNTTTADITDVELSINVVNENNKYYIYNSLFTNKPNQVYSRTQESNQDWSDFNTSNIFKW